MAVNLAWGTPEDLGGPYVTFLFVFIAVVYVVNILYVLLFKLLPNLALLAKAQLGVDLISARSWSTSPAGPTAPSCSSSCSPRWPPP